MHKKSISEPNLLKLLDERNHKAYYGCNQEWYATEWQRLSGCGPAAACNMIFYLNHTQPAFGLGQRINSKDSLLSLMEEIWEYVTPTKQGIPTTKMFYEAMLNYTKAKGLNVEYGFCNVPENKFHRPELSEIINFLENALIKDAPVAFLNLCNGEVKNLDRWHWVTIISLEYAEDGNTAFVDILDEGLIKNIDLALWYNTTRLGGGFVYFTASPVADKHALNIGQIVTLEI
jgi:hypothetical protein